MCHESGAGVGTRGNAAWIERRCGVRERYVAEPETTSTLAVEASRRALADASVRPDVLICSTFTPDYGLCPVAPSIARALDLGSVPAFDLNAACAGGIVGLTTALDPSRPDCGYR